MNGRGFITISMHELERVKIIEAVVQHRLTIVLAAERLQLCERQVSRLVQRYQAAGVAGLVSGKRGRAGNHQLPDGMARRSLAIIRERYADFGPTLYGGEPEARSPVYRRVGVSGRAHRGQAGWYCPSLRPL